MFMNLIKMEKDLEFLKEMKQKLQDAIDGKDTTKFEFVQQMIDDWIDELEKSLDN